MSISITRRLEFDAGHRVWGHEGKCNNLHGHRYAVEITVEADRLDSLGRVIDFGVIKSRVGGWIDQFWDHQMLLNSGDPMCDVMFANGQTFFAFPARNPTAENIARELFARAERLLPEMTIKRVVCWETPNCSASYPS